MKVAWIVKPQRVHEVHIQLGVPNHNDPQASMAAVQGVLDWLSDAGMCPGIHYNIAPNTGRHPRTRADVLCYCFLFTRADQAALFKLTWG